MEHKLRNGVKLVECCGEYLLISTLGARSFCPYIMSLNEDSAYLWSLLSKGADTEDIIREVAEKYEMPVEMASETVTGFMSSLEENGYILPGEGEKKK